MKLVSVSKIFHIVRITLNRSRRKSGSGVVAILVLLLGCPPGWRAWRRVPDESPLISEIGSARRATCSRPSRCVSSCRWPGRRARPPGPSTSRSPPPSARPSACASEPPSAACPSTSGMSLGSLPIPQSCESLLSLVEPQAGKPLGLAHR